MFLSISNSIWKVSLFCIAAWLLLMKSTSAQTTATESFNIGSALQCLSSSGDFTLPDFNTSLGTLESVTLTLTLTNSSKINVYNTSGNLVDFVNASLILPGSVTGPDGVVLSTALDATVASGVANPGINSYGTTMNPVTVSAVIDPSSFDLWEGSTNGAVDFSYSKGNSTYQGTDLGGGLLFGGTLKGCGEVTVEYTYLSSGSSLATPEPPGRYLSAIAAAGMALMLFGRKRFVRS